MILSPEEQASLVEFARQCDQALSSCDLAHLGLRSVSDQQTKLLQDQNEQIATLQAQTEKNPWTWRLVFFVLGGFAGGYAMHALTK